MPAFAVSAVDTTANTFTATGVAAAGGAEGSVLTTGDRFRLRNVGGALPAATPSLAGATDYFSRRVTDDSIQIYDSNAHALAGGSTGLVDITGSGSGTTTIEFGLPYALPTVFAAQGIQLRPFVVGAVWNALVALYSLLTGQAQSVWSAITFAMNLTVTGLFIHEQTWQHSIAFALPDASASLSFGAHGSLATRLALQGSTGDNVLPLAIPVGTITKWSVTINKSSATGTITARCYEAAHADGTSPAQVGSDQTNAANNPGAITLGQTGLSFAMTAGREYFIVVNGGGATGDMVTSYYAAVTGT